MGQGTGSFVVVVAYFIGKHLLEIWSVPHPPKLNGALVRGIMWTTTITTPLKFNIAPKKLPSNRKVVFQPPFFRGYVKLRRCTCFCWKYLSSCTSDMESTESTIEKCWRAQWRTNPPSFLQKGWVKYLDRGNDHISQQTGRSENHWLKSAGCRRIC